MNVDFNAINYVKVYIGRPGQKGRYEVWDISRQMNYKGEPTDYS